MPLLEMDYQTHILSNGIRLIHKHSTSPVAHCGIIISTGSRDEKPEEHGMVHFIEHLLFKGTKKRKSYNILSRMEDVGGEINAYTTKEDTCIYSTFFSNYYPRALELISDIVFNSDFPDKEIEKEKEVIIDEINSYRDTPSEMIFDEFEELIFRNNPIGRNILGDKEKLKAFTRDDILRFVENGYCTAQMVVSSVGNITFSRLVKHFERYFGNIAAKTAINKRIKYSGYSPIYREMNYNTHQSHCVIGNVAYNIKNEKRLVLNLLDNLLGGPGLNSRLSMSLRERQGYVYNIDSSYTPYSDTGIISIYFGTDKTDVNISIKTVLAELRKLRMRPLTNAQLIKAKRQILGQIAISLENNENLMLSMGKSLLIFNRVDTLEEIRAKYDSITAKDLLNVANDIFNKDRLSYLIYK
jgi:predicted Zn-dependent peptidase